MGYSEGAELGSLLGSEDGSSVGDVVGANVIKISLLSIVSRLLLARSYE